MKSKLIQVTDLSGRDKFYFCFESGNEVIQQEINHLEYQQLRSAEENHFANEIANLKHKYRILEQEQQNQ